ncbi:two-component system histidine kinase PnpS [Sediminibacillus massiliensis]|uniref:two-component system histidine kinase PnpS n=1 Tax=Sediminibacillus massiliensis TaxID=1926277 RepID=UPI0009884455|nr:ATP-binding protein [Sediminibacillus massiliensis]
MGGVNIRPFISYLLVVIFIMAAMGAILIPLLSPMERVIGILTISGSLIVFLVLIVNIFEKYIKPVQSSAMVADELVKGNYKARTYVSYFGEAGRLSNSINKLASSLQEITLQEKMQENQLGTVIDNMESGLMLVDEKGYVHMVNRKFMDIFGGKFKDYVGFLYYDVLEEEKIHQAVQEAFLYEEKVKDSFINNHGIQRRFVEIVGAPIFNEKQVLKGAVIVFHDITELKKLEEMRKDFVANVSHELKTPITSIRGFAETLLDGAMDDPEARTQFLNIIYKESARLQALVHDLLELSKLEKEELQLYRGKVHLNRIINDVVPLISQQAEKKNILFEKDIKANIEFIGDMDRVKQILINLLNNAVNYTPEGGVVRLKANEDENTIYLEISDTGIGIPDKDKTRVFERFYRVDPARSRNTGGTGLGLAIVKHIVETHHGEIEMESEVDKGTTFLIKLPKNLK